MGAFNFSLKPKPAMETIEERTDNPQELAWVGFDLDSTLAVHTKWISWDHIGDPIPKMIEKVKWYLSQGATVKILTARCSKVSLARNKLTFAQMESVIQDWTEKYIGVRLPVVSEKDCYMIHFFDDSCIQVEPNTGRIAGGEEAESFKPFYGKEEEYNLPVEEIEESSISGTPDYNMQIIKNEWVKAFVLGIRKAGVDSAARYETRGCQEAIHVIKNGVAEAKVFLNTRKGTHDGTTYHWYLMCDVYVANGSNRVVFQMDGISYKSVGKNIGTRILSSNAGMFPVKVLPVFKLNDL